MTLERKRVVLYVHGKGGNVQEAEHYKYLFPDYEVFGIDYRGDTPWDTEIEIQKEYDRFSVGATSVILIANSIGAYFSMNALYDRDVEKAFFISPMVNMEKLITDMMNWAGVSEEELQEKGEIPTEFGETLLWKYLQYVRQHPVKWQVPTKILYAGGDHLVSRETITTFAQNYHADLQVMEDGEHWFHTVEQMAFLDNWILSNK